MNPKLQLISLTLTNIVGTDSEVNLLSSPSGENNSAFDTYYNLSFQFLTNISFLFRYTLNDVIYDEYFFTQPNIDTFIVNLNAEFSPNAVFSYELNGSAPNYYLKIRILNSNFIPVFLQSLA